MTTIITKNSSTASAVPVSGDLTQGELAVNVTDKKLYTKDSGGSVVKIVGSLGNQEASSVTLSGGSINGTTVGAVTPSTGAFTTLSASSTVSGTGFSTYLASPPAIGGTAAAAGSFTTLSASSTVTLSGGTANGVLYLNGSKVATSGSALTFDGTNLGIGTSSPSFSTGSGLQVNRAGTSNIRISNSTTGLATELYQTDTTTGFSIDARGTNNFTRFLTDGTERARIDSSGYLLINQTSNVTSSYLQIKGAQPAISCESTSTGSVSQVLFRNPNGQVGSIGTSGTSTSYNTSSDYRLKENIAPMTGALAKVAALNPVTYNWKVDGSAGQGFIAHELQAVVPDCVTGEKDAVDAEGKPQYQGVDTSFLVATLTAAIKEQQALIEQLTTRIAALEAK